MKFLCITLLFFLIACKTSSRIHLAGETWLLYELNGTPVDTHSIMQNKPMIAFVVNENKFNGNTGCNRMGGHYELKEGNRIRFYNVITTKMACLNSTDLENRFLEVINIADSYNLNGNTLMLNKARMAPLARFKRM
jgi:heat shock protein HslJ